MPSPPTSTISHPPGSSDDRGTSLKGQAPEWTRTGVLGPIPLREAVVEVSVIKPGRRVQLTATLLRPSAGEWVRLACRTYLADGVGLAHADLFDPGGLIGEVARPLLVRKREPGNGVA
jgi:hypothetical protein